MCSSSVLTGTSVSGRQGVHNLNYHRSSNMNDSSKEYFWACQLTKENPTFTWTFDEEDEDTDYLMHTLFLKHAVLGAGTLDSETNLLEVEARDFDNKLIKSPILSLTKGRNDMCAVDLSFGCTATFKLIEGCGPLHLSGAHLVEFPNECNLSQNESELTEESQEAEEEDLEEESPKKPLKSKKRKASTQNAGKSKKGKMMEVSGPSKERIVHRVSSATGEVSPLQITFRPGKDDDDEEEDEEEDMDEDDDDEDASSEEESEEEESSPEKKKKKTAAAKGKAGKKPAKQVSPKKGGAKKKKVGKK